MADVLINQNNRRMDDEDLNALIAALQEMGFSAEVDPSTRVEAARPSEWWVLYLALGWIGAQTAEAAYQALLEKLAQHVARHFRSRRKPPPNRIDLYGPDGYTVLASVDVEEDDDSDEGLVRRPSA